MRTSYFPSAMLLVSVMFLTTLPALAREKANIQLDSKDIKLERVKLISRAVSDASPAVKEYGEDWWMVDVTFSTEEEITREIKVEVYLGAYDYFNEQLPDVVLTGEVTFINVLKGNKHRATFYLHPGSAKRYGGKIGITSYSKKHDHNVHVIISDKESRQVVEMDKEEGDEPNWFRQGVVPGVLIGVQDSPWWPYECLAYSQIKQER